MAKTAVNKSQKIRDAMKAEPRKTPSEIAEMLKAQGLNVSGQYVSTIKSNARKARRLARRTLIVRGTARKTRGTGRSSSMSGIPAALEFIKAAGGLENAKSALGTIEEIGNAVR